MDRSKTNRLNYEYNDITTYKYDITTGAYNDCWLQCPITNGSFVT